MSMSWSNSRVMDSTQSLNFYAKQYQQLPLQSRTSKRLLTLLSGKADEPLRCYFTEVERQSRERYEALSYTWGDPVLPQIVLVCDPASEEKRPIAITQNLFDALRRLRKAIPRVLWIDALCIDQDNLQEKGHQVAHMGQIYRSASRVIVWLGEDQMCSQTKAGLLQQHHRSHPSHGHYEELKTIPWFFRVWTVQEYLLAKRVFFQIGSLAISSSAFDSYISRFEVQNFSLFVQIQLGKVPSNEFDTISQLFRQRQQLRGLRKEPGQAIEMMEFLNLSSQRDCKDDRDRIYGLLGIIQTIKMTPDYTLSTKQVFAEFVSKTIASGDFSVLHACCIGTPNGGMPSYVPALGRSTSPYISIASAFLNRPGFAPFCAGFGSEPKVSVDKDCRILIRGVSIDTVVGVLGFSDSCTTGVLRYETPDTIPIDSTLDIQCSIALSHILPDAFNHRPWLQTLERSIFGERIPTSRSEIYKHIPLFNILSHTMTVVAPLRHVPPWWGHDQRASRNCEWAHAHNLLEQTPLKGENHRTSLLERSLFWTKQGFIGIGTGHLRPGDQAVVFDGDSTAFLLRKTKSKEDNIHGVFKIVGDCYVYGWMREEEGKMIPLFTGLPTAELSEDRCQGRVCPVTGREVNPQVFVIQ